MTWIREELGGIPAQVSGASFSSLRQSMMGTYSISSTVMAEPGPTGATYICQVAHVSLEEPLTVSMRVLPITGIGVSILFPCIQAGTPLPTGHRWLWADAHALPQFHLCTLDFIFPRVSASTTMTPQPPIDMSKLGLGTMGKGVLFLPTRSRRDELRQAGKRTQIRPLSPAQVQQEGGPQD